MAVRCERQNNCGSSSNSDNVESYALLSICILRECRLRLIALGWPHSSPQHCVSTEIKSVQLVIVYRKRAREKNGKAEVE